VLVHCWHGSDRTGIVVAAYRIVFEGLSVQEAEAELRADTYGHHEFWYGNLVKLLRSTDWDAMRSRLKARSK
jgi:protein tyrosine/serine phosphatase